MAEIIDIRDKISEDELDEEYLENVDNEMFRKLFKAAVKLAEMSAFKRARYAQVYNAIDLYEVGVAWYDVKEVVKAFVKCMEYEFIATERSTKYVFADIRGILFRLDAIYPDLHPIKK
jgi:hypothetical protein